MVLKLAKLAVLSVLLKTTVLLVYPEDWVGVCPIVRNGKTLAD